MTVNPLQITMVQVIISITIIIVEKVGVKARMEAKLGKAGMEAKLGKARMEAKVEKAGMEAKLGKARMEAK